MASDDSEQAFFDTAEPELRAFAKRQTARKVVTMAAMLVAMLAGGVAVGWAMFHGMH